jgi:hypothetical protein
MPETIVPVLRLSVLSVSFRSVFRDFSNLFHFLPNSSFTNHRILVSMLDIFSTICTQTLQSMFFALREEPSFTLVKLTV